MAGLHLLAGAPSPLLLRPALAPRASAAGRGRLGVRLSARAQVRRQRGSRGKGPEGAEGRTRREAPSNGATSAASGTNSSGPCRRALLLGASGLALAAAAGPAMADAGADVTAEVAEVVATTAGESVAAISGSAEAEDVAAAQGGAAEEAGAEANEPPPPQDPEPQARDVQAEAAGAAPEAAAEQEPEPAAASEAVLEQPVAPEPAPAPPAAELAPTPAAAAPEAAPAASSIEAEVQRRQQELYLQKKALDEARLLEQNRRMQSLNGAPGNFPAFVRDGFNVTVVAGPEYVRTPSGLIYWDIAPGTGDVPKAGQQVEFHYTGYNESGRRIDSSYNQGRPAQSRMGINAMIPGFEEGISTMKAGGTRRVVVPPELGPPTGPSTFFSAKQYEVFDIELLSIKNCERRQVLFYSDVVCE